MAAGSKTIGGINVTISATTNKFEQGVNRARTSLGKFDQALKGIGLSLKGFGIATAAAFATQGFKNAAESIDSLSKSAQKIGITTGKMAGLRLAAEEAGLSSETLDRALVKISNSSGKSADVALLDLVDSAGKMTTQQQKLALATEAFGAKGASMVQILNLGRDGLIETEEAAKRLGLAVGDEAAKGVENMNDKIGRLGKAFKGLFSIVTAEVAPGITAAVEGLTTTITTLVDSFKAMAFWGKRALEMLPPGLRQRPQTLTAPTAASRPLGVSTPGGRAIGGRGTFSTGRGWGSDQYGDYAVYSGGKIDPKATEAQRLIRAFLLNDGDPGRQRGFKGMNFLKILGNTSQGQILKSIGGQAGKLPGMASGAWAKFLFDDMMGGHRLGAAGGGGLGGSRGVSALDPNSREGSAQRVRSLAQNDLQKIGRQQLKTQQGILAALKKNPIVLAAANLAGG